MKHDEEQLGFDFGEKDLSIADDEALEATFRGFHEKHPQVWRTFRKATLVAAEQGVAPILPHTIMRVVRETTGIVVDYKLIPFYAELFVSTHQELSWVWKKG